MDEGFKDYNAANGIMTEKTIREAPQQDVVERMDKTINEHAGRLHLGLPKTLCADAVSIAIYLNNCSLSVSLEGKLLDVWNRIRQTFII